MKDLLNAGQILGRSEMKKIMAGSSNCEPGKCRLNCDQSTSGGVCLDSCDFDDWCIDPSNAVCVCT